MRKCHVGPLPPLLGGVSVYLYRLRRLKPDDRYVDITQLGKKRFLCLLCQSKEEVVLHEYNLKMILAMYLFSFFSGLKYAVVFHGERIFQKKNKIAWFLLRKSLQRASDIYFVNLKLQNRMTVMFPELIRRSVVLTPFLPPPPEDEQRILAGYSQEFYRFIECSSPLLVANASKLRFWHDGTDLYGLDMCVELVRKLKAKYPRIGLIFALADDSGEPHYFSKVRERISANDLDDNIYFMTGQQELWPLFRKADLMVRPTCTDGYGISIAEALYFHCPAIASDVCVRPEGTILFENRNMDDLYEKVSRILDQKDFVSC